MLEVSTLVSFEVEKQMMLLRGIIMNRLGFEELELQVQPDVQLLKSYLQQISVSYSIYHYWRKKCSVCRNSVKQELTPISFKQTVTASSPEKKCRMVWSFCFPMVFVSTFSPVFDTCSSPNVYIELVFQEVKRIEDAT